MDVIYTAETDDGSIYYVSGIKGGGSRQEFADSLILHLRTLPQDEATPRGLSLYEWADPQTLGAWLKADTPVGGTWTEMANLAQFGVVEYGYVGGGEGDWSYREVAFEVPAGN